MFLPLLLLALGYLWWTHRDVVSAAVDEPGDEPLGDLTNTAADGQEVQGYRDGQPFTFTARVVDDAGHVLADDAGAAFLDMKAAAAADGVELHVNSAWRPYSQQVQFFAAFRAGTGPQAAPPGYSNHEAGDAADIETAGGSNAAFKWLTANAERFNFKRTVASEPWHWEYSA